MLCGRKSPHARQSTPPFPVAGRTARALRTIRWRSPRPLFSLSLSRLRALLPRSLLVCSPSPRARPCPLSPPPPPLPSPPLSPARSAARCSRSIRTASLLLSSSSRARASEIARRRCCLAARCLADRRVGNPRARPRSPWLAPIFGGRRSAACARRCRPHAWIRTANLVVRLGAWCTPIRGGWAGLSVAFARPAPRPGGCFPLGARRSPLVSKARMCLWTRRRARLRSACRTPRASMRCRPTLW